MANFQNCHSITAPAPKWVIAKWQQKRRSPRMQRCEETSFFFWNSQKELAFVFMMFGINIEAICTMLVYVRWKYNFDILSCKTVYRLFLKSCIIKLEFTKSWNKCELYFEKWRMSDTKNPAFFRYIVLLINYIVYSLGLWKMLLCCYKAIFEKWGGELC